MSVKWYCKIRGRKLGPLSVAQLKGMAARGKVRPDSLVRQSGSNQWVPASRVKGLFSPGAKPPSREPAPAGPIRQATPPPTAPRPVAPRPAAPPTTAPPAAALPTATPPAMPAPAAQQRPPVQRPSLPPAAGLPPGAAVPVATVARASAPLPVGTVVQPGHAVPAATLAAGVGSTASSGGILQARAERKKRSRTNLIIVAGAGVVFVLVAGAIAVYGLSGGWSDGGKVAGAASPAAGGGESDASASEKAGADASENNDAAAGAAEGDGPAADPRRKALESVSRWHNAVTVTGGWKGIVLIHVDDAWLSSDPTGRTKDRSLAAGVGENIRPGDAGADGDEPNGNDANSADPNSNNAGAVSTGADSAVTASAPPPKYVFILLSITNAGQTTAQSYTSWNGPAGTSFDTKAILADDKDNFCSVAPYAEAGAPGRRKTGTIKPGETITDLLVFNAPPGDFHSLRLALTSAAVGRTGKSERWNGFEIPKEMLAGKTKGLNKPLPNKPTGEKPNNGLATDKNAEEPADGHQADKTNEKPFVDNRTEEQIYGGGAIPIPGLQRPVDEEK